jgi:hypothetical protein
MVMKYNDGQACSGVADRARNECLSDSYATTEMIEKKGKGNECKKKSSNVKAQNSAPNYLLWPYSDDSLHWKCSWALFSTPRFAA